VGSTAAAAIGCPPHVRGVCVDRADGGRTVPVRVGQTLMVALSGSTLRWSGLQQVGPALLHRHGAVRQEPVFALEELVHEFTEVPARLYGLAGRGRIEEGFHADLVLFDPERIGASPVRMVRDLPGGAARLDSHGVGIESVIVAGEEVVHHGRFTGRRPGHVLRSGTDSVSGGPPHRGNAA
jgi:N-acyl-D-aspartate/D-glutamate deacylase